MCVCVRAQVPWQFTSQLHHLVVSLHCRGYVVFSRGNVQMARNTKKGMTIFPLLSLEAHCSLVGPIVLGNSECLELPSHAYTLSLEGTHQLSTSSSFSPTPQTTQPSWNSSSFRFPFLGHVGHRTLCHTPHWQISCSRLGHQIVSKNISRIMLPHWNFLTEQAIT